MHQQTCNSYITDGSRSQTETLSAWKGLSAREAGRPRRNELFSIEEDLERGPPGVGGMEPLPIEYLADELGTLPKPDYLGKISMSASLNTHWELFLSSTLPAALLYDAFHGIWLPCPYESEAALSRPIFDSSACIEDPRSPCGPSEKERAAEGGLSYSSMRLSIRKTGTGDLRKGTYFAIRHHYYHLGKHYTESRRVERHRREPSSSP